MEGRLIADGLKWKNLQQQPQWRKKKWQLLYRQVAVANTVVAVNQEEPRLNSCCQRKELLRSSKRNYAKAFHSEAADVKLVPLNILRQIVVIQNPPVIEATAVASAGGEGGVDHNAAGSESGPDHNHLSRSRKSLLHSKAKQALTPIQDTPISSTAASEKHAAENLRTEGVPEQATPFQKQATPPNSTESLAPYSSKNDGASTENDSSGKQSHNQGNHSSTHIPNVNHAAGSTANLQVRRQVWEVESRILHELVGWEVRKKSFTWDPEMEGQIKAAWSSLAANRYRDLTRDLREWDEQPGFIQEDVWASFKQHWETESFQKVRRRNAKNHKSSKKRPVHHTGGLVSFVEHMGRLECILGHKPLPYEVFAYTHTIRHDFKTFIDSNAKKVHAKYIRIKDRVIRALAEDSEPERELDEDALYLHVVGELATAYSELKGVEAAAVGGGARLRKSPFIIMFSVNFNSEWCGSEMTVDLLKWPSSLMT
ncbi:OLC1v1008242C1 [Oldenlandia corymbosa var. corymbosa]|uniref:OLC1v1008242C1 n=1 Tax=Oldenlandia corymbosa var. corymbosa TaxID=529605 RepID=A0AAV1DPG7_OLDCO|nr:OLC1v1008242C1 [Oldenlandia corymbosa var. corymbosa]